MNEFEEQRMKEKVKKMTKEIYSKLDKEIKEI